jgi:transcriptional regulator with XRE-family HTH domain
MRHERVAGGYTMEQVVKSTGVSKASISRIERGIGEPLYPSVLALARFYGIQDLMELEP